ncbi:hypothetical protein [Streptomyces sp. NPDC018031]|uniref:hypothetical protein n=1 Tax=Streptomyces sp. NPDC018031 TaxID=3365033 RepID=UPI0037B873F9
MAPQTPPPGAGGYGYPGPAGYPTPTHAQPTQVGMPMQPYGTGGQPQYGYPQTQQQPQMPQGPGGPGGGDRKAARQRLMIIISAVVAVALIVGAGIFFIAKDDGGGGKADDDNKTSQGPTGGPEEGPRSKFKAKPAPAMVDARLLNSVRVPKVKDQQVTVPGLWATDKIFAKTEDFKITGYPVGGGSAEWEIPLDGQVCEGWRGVTKDNLTAVVFEDHKPKNDKDYARCTEVGLIDLDEGKLVWQKHIESTGSPVTFEEVTIGAGAVAAGGLDGGAAWSLDGKELWAPQDGADCEDRGYEGSEDKLVAATYCGEYDNPSIKVSSVNPKNGDIISGYELPRGIKDVHVVSADPLVLGLEAAGESYDVSDVWVIDDSAKTGKLKTKISTRNGQYVVNCGSSNIGGCTQIVVSEQTETVFMASEARSGGGAGTVNEIVAFSMKTGKTIGKADGDKEAETVPLSLDEDGYLIAYQLPTYDAGGMVWRVDPTTYKKDPLMRNPSASADKENWFTPDSSWISYVNGHLYLGYVYASKATSSFDRERLLAMGFGAG